MAWLDYNKYFREIDDPFLTSIFKDSPYPWSPILKLKSAIDKYFNDLTSIGSLTGKRVILKDGNNQFIEGSYFINESQILQKEFIDKELKIYIGSGTLIEAGATIKNHTIIRNNCEVRQSAYLRGFTFVGDHSVIGHTTEVKNSIFIKHVEAGHFAYIGDSIIGAYVNLGAGTKLSNLQFRSLIAKKTENFPIIQFKYKNENFDTQLSKFGAIIGDGCETGCNSVLCPFVFLEPECWIMPNYCVVKGVYKRGTLFRNKK